MQVVTIKKRTIIRQTAILLLCGAAGWYLKGKLSPQVPMMSMSGGDPYVLVQGIEKQDISPKKNFIGHVEAINSVDLSIYPGLKELFLRLRVLMPWLMQEN